MSGIPRFPKPSDQYDRRNEAEFRRLLTAFLAGVRGLAGTTGGGGGFTQAEADLLYATLAHTHPQSEITGLVAALAAKQATIARASVTKTTGSLAVSATETGTIVLSKAGLILNVSADRACWVRLYGTSAERTADAGRLITADPSVPCLADLIFSASVLTIPTAPLIGYANRDGSPVTTLYYAIVNKSAGTSTVAVTFDHLPLEG